MSIRSITFLVARQVEKKFVDKVDGDATDSNIVLNFNNKNKKRFDYNETVKIHSFLSGANNVTIAIKEKNSVSDFIGYASTQITVTDEKFGNTLRKIVLGYEKLGKATIQFYDSL